MITINLKPGAKRTTSGGPAGARLGERLKELASLVKDPARAAAIGLGIVVVAGGIWGFISSGMAKSSLTPQLEEARSENLRFRTLLGQIRREERVRDSVGMELLTLRQVDRDRYVWPHILEDVSRALPGMAWLVGLSPVSGASGSLTIDSLGQVVRPPLTIEITGRTMDIQGYTRFMRELESSPWLENVRAISASTLVEGNRAVTAFVVRATYTEADSTYVRLEPIGQSGYRTPDGGN